MAHQISGFQSLSFSLKRKQEKEQEKIPWCDCMRVCSVTQSCLTLCNPMDCNLPRSSVHGIFQARILEWVVIAYSRGSSQLRNRTQVSCIAGEFFYSLSQQGSPRILAWVTYPFARGSSWSRNQTRVSCIAGGFFTSWATQEALLRVYFSISDDPF